MILQWIRRVLGIDSLERLASQALSNANDGIDGVRQLQKLVQVGVDVGYHNGSWAVICIAGKSEYVNFVNLGREDVQRVRQFLRQFEGSQRTIDLPHGIPKELFL